MYRSFMDTKSSFGNPNPNFATSRPSKPMVALRFLCALSLVRRTGPAAASPSSRARRIRRAAYACMAYSTGPRQAWSRALLRKLLRRRRQPYRGLQRQITVNWRRRPVGGGNRLEVALRRLVPGGGGMEYCRLLEEAADYVKCLARQVRLMQSIVDSASRVNSIN